MNNTALPTQEQFKRYLEVQQSGRFNMIAEATFAQCEACLDRDTYWAIINNYNELMEQHELT
jgi:hypothetical protein